MDEKFTLITSEDYEKAMQRIEEIIATTPKEGTDAFQELDELASRIADYEEIHFPIN
ncbi:MAG: hypothetical protein ACRCYO_19705 [Bacteroidia bacterium]